MLRTPAHHITVVHTDSERAAAGEEIELEPSIRSTNRSYNHHRCVRGGSDHAAHPSSAHACTVVRQSVFPYFP